MLENGRDRAECRVRLERGRADGELDGRACGQRGAHLGGGLARDADDRHLNGLVDPERAGGDRAVDEDGANAGSGELAHHLGRRRPRGKQRRRSGDAAVPRVVEQRVERVPLGDRDDLPAWERRDGSRDDSGRRDGAAERRLTGREDAQARAQEDVHRRASTARVGRRDTERPGRAAGRGDAAEPGTGGTVVPRRRDDERVERKGAVRRRLQRRVREGGERLDDPDERDPHRIVGIAVAVRVDGRLEAREHLVRAPVHGHAAVRVRLPAGDPDRQDRRARRHAVDPGRPADTRDEAGELCPVALRAARLGRVLLRGRVAPRVDHVEPRQQPPLQERVPRVDAGVEQRDRDAGAVEPRQLDLGPTTAPRGEHVGLEDRAVRGDRRWIGSPDGEHALDGRVTLQRGEQPRVERGGEAVQDADVRLLGLHRDAAERETRDRAVLRVAGGGRPDTHLQLAGAASHRPNTVGERRRAQDDDPAAPELRERTASQQPLPALGSGRLLRRPRRAAGREQAGREQRGERGLRSTQTNTHRGQGSRGTRAGRPNRAADAIMAALSVASESGAKRASGSAARSSELAATPPTTATVRSPVRSAPARSRPTSAVTIARWYDAARSARRAASSSSESSRTA